MRVRRLQSPSPVTRDSFDIAYAAHTVTCTFLLDEAGICRRVVMAASKRAGEGKPLARCVGAQYVASLDGRTPGGLVELPRVGASMLFARVDEKGRISLVRTGVVTKFETKIAPSRRKPTHDPFEQTDGVRTSAPDVSQTTTPRGTRTIPPAETFDDDDFTPATVRGGGSDHVYADLSDRTQRIPAIAEAMRAEIPPPGPSDEDAIDIDVDDLATAEYPSAPAPTSGEGRRATLPSSLAPPALPTTLRQPVRDRVPSSDDLLAYGGASRKRLGRPRSEGSLRVVSSAAAARISQPDAVPDAPRSDLQLASPRRRP